MSRCTRDHWFRAFSSRARRLGQTAPPERRRLRFETLEDRRLLAVLTVNTTVDENNGVGVGGVSLREALAAAVAGDVVDFAPALTSGGPAAINLLHGQLLVDKNLTIQGPGAGLLTINAQGASRVFQVTADATIEKLTITGGSAVDGGGVLVSGDLTLRQSVVTGNTATNRGGGIFLDHAGALIDQTTVSNNTAQNLGGGVAAESWSARQVTISRSTLSGNGATGAGGRGGGIGLMGDGLQVAVHQSTISGNSAQSQGGGVYMGPPFGPVFSVDVRYSTITLNSAGQGAGIFRSGHSPISLRSSIVSGNLGADIQEYAGSFIGDNGYNVIGTVSDLSGSDGTSQVGVLDPFLLPLADNGGPTRTHLVMPHSPAFNAGPVAVAGEGGVPLFDQRGDGYSRVGGGRIDVGAFELNYPQFESLVVDTLIDEFDGDFGPGKFSLREAVALAHVAATPATITFAPELAGGVIALTMGEIVMAKAMTIDGAGLSAPVTIDAQQASRIFSIIATAGDFTLAGLTLTGGKTTGNNDASIFGPFSGGAIRSLTMGTLTIDRSTVSGNSTTGVRAIGGGIFARGNVVLTSSTVSGNHATGSATGGGGIAANDVTLTGSTVSDNTAHTNGGGIWTDLGNLTLTQSTVSGNSAGNFGGGIYANIGQVKLTQSTISGNTANTFGGGIFTQGDPFISQSSGNVTLVQSTVSGNASGTGGGIWTDLGNLTLTQSTVSGNSGGGIGADAGDVTLTNSTVSGNNGDGIFGRRSVTLTQSTVSGNSGFGVSGVGPTNVTLTNSTVSGNSGGIRAGRLTIRGSILAGNTAGGASPDWQSTSSAGATSSYSLLGTGVPHAGVGNVVTDDPQLGPLQYNGGPTFLDGSKLLTHAPLPGSPAIDAGDPFFNPAATGQPFDQRGEPWARVVRATPGATNDEVGLAEIRFGAAGGQIVQPTAAFASTYYSSQQLPANLINGSGLTAVGDVMTWTHATHNQANGMWHAGAGQGIAGAPPVVANQYVVIDLGASYDLSTAYLWQMVQPNLLGRALKEFRLLASPDAPADVAGNPPAVYDLAGFTEVLGVTQLAATGQAVASTTQAFALAGATNVRTIYLDVLSSYNTGARVDMGAVELQSHAADFDFDGDVDGRDFLIWQRGGSPNPFSSSDLALWQEQYGIGGGLSALSDQLATLQVGSSTTLVEEIVDLGFMVADGEDSRPEQAVAQFRLGAAVAGTRVTRFGLPLDSHLRGNDESGWKNDVFDEDSYFEEVDRAIEELTTMPRNSVRDFGNIAVRRGVARRFDAGSLSRAI